MFRCSTYLDFLLYYNNNFYHESSYLNNGQTKKGATWKFLK